MKKKLTLLMILTLGAMLLVSACGGGSEAPASGGGDAAPASGSNNVVSNAVNAVSNSVAYMLNGNVKGEIGKAYSTKWFEFTVKSIAQVDSYAGYEPQEGYVLYDVLINEKCTFDEDTPMGTFDFYMDSEPWPEYIWPIDPLDDTMMPDEFIMVKNDVVEYHMIYEVPADTEGLMLCYTEYDENEDVGATFTIAIN